MHHRLHGLGVPAPGVGRNRSSLQPNASLLLPETERLAARIIVLPTGTTVGARETSLILRLVRTALAQAQAAKQALALRVGDSGGAGSSANTWTAVTLINPNRDAANRSMPAWKQGWLVNSRRPQSVVGVAQGFPAR